MCWCISATFNIFANDCLLTRNSVQNPYIFVTLHGNKADIMVSNCLYIISHDLCSFNPVTTHDNLPSIQKYISGSWNIWCTLWWRYIYLYVFLTLVIKEKEKLDYAPPSGKENFFFLIILFLFLCKWVGGKWFLFFSFPLGGVVKWEKKKKKRKRKKVGTGTLHSQLII